MQNCTVFLFDISKSGKKLHYMNDEIYRKSVSSLEKKTFLASRNSDYVYFFITRRGRLVFDEKNICRFFLLSLSERLDST